MAKFKVGDVVEDTTKGDLPFFVLAIDLDRAPPAPSRYTIESIKGERFSNFPEYLLAPARPPDQSKWGKRGVR